MRLLFLASLVAVVGCENVAGPGPDVAVTTGADLANQVDPDLGASSDATFFVPGAWRFAGPPSSDLVVLARGTDGGAGVVAFASDGTSLHEAAGSTASASSHQLLRAESEVWWPALGANGIALSLAARVVVSDDGLYLAIEDAGTLRAGPRDALVSLPSTCHHPRFAPLTHHLYVDCADGLYRLGANLPADALVRVATSSGPTAFASDGETIVLVAPKLGETRPRVIAAPTSLATLDAVQALGTFASDDGAVDFFLVVPDRPRVVYVAHEASAYVAKELDWSTGMVRERVELGTNPYPVDAPWTVPCDGAGGVTSTLLVCRSGTSMIVDELGTGTWSDRIFGALADALPSGPVAIQHAGMTLNTWTVVGPQLAGRYTCPFVHHSMGRLLDEERTLMWTLHFPELRQLVQLCSASGVTSPLPEPVLELELERTTRRLYYILDDGVRALRL